VYPENNKYWDDIELQRDYLDRIGEQIGIHSLEEWYCMTANDVEQKTGSTFLMQFGNSLLQLLVNIYPEYPMANMEIWTPFQISLARHEDSN